MPLRSIYGKNPRGKKQQILASKISTIFQNLLSGGFEISDEASKFDDGISAGFVGFDDNGANNENEKFSWWAANKLVSDVGICENWRIIVVVDERLWLVEIFDNMGRTRIDTAEVLDEIDVVVVKIFAGIVVAVVSVFITDVERRCKSNRFNVSFFVVITVVDDVRQGVFIQYFAKIIHHFFFSCFSAIRLRSIAVNSFR